MLRKIVNVQNYFINVKYSFGTLIINLFIVKVITI